MNDTVEPTIRKVEAYVQGFFWILRTSPSRLWCPVFIGGAWAAKRGVIHLFAASERGDLGLLLGGFAKWVIILFGLLVVARWFPS
jgi:hypothetical protein